PHLMISRCLALANSFVQFFFSRLSRVPRRSRTFCRLKVGQRGHSDDGNRLHSEEARFTLVFKCQESWHRCSHRRQPDINTLVLRETDPSTAVASKIGHCRNPCVGCSADKRGQRGSPVPSPEQGCSKQKQGRGRVVGNSVGLRSNHLRCSFA